jgi:hypothetical protein
MKIRTKAPNSGWKSGRTGLCERIYDVNIYWFHISCLWLKYLIFYLKYYPKLCQYSIKSAELFHFPRENVFHQHCTLHSRDLFSPLFQRCNAISINWTTYSLSLSQCSKIRLDIFPHCPHSQSVSYYNFTSKRWRI